jgi:hypothetical protein
MRLDPITTSIGNDQVTYFSMVSGPGDERLHEIVGQIAIEFGRLEYLVKAAIEKITRELAVQGGLAEEDVRFIDGMLQAENKYTFSACCSHLDELYAKWQTDPERVSAFSALVERLLRSGEERNAIIHGCWSTSPTLKSGAAAASEGDTFLRLRSRYDRKSKALHQSVERFTIYDLTSFFRTVNWQRYLLGISIGDNLIATVPIAAAEPPMKPSRSSILLSELVPTARMLGIELATLARTIGLSVHEIEAVIDGHKALPPDGPSYGRASVLSDVLERLLGRGAGDVEAARNWLTSIHKRLAASPLEAMQSVEGFIKLATIPLDE